MAIPPQEQAWRLAAVRQARCGGVLALQVLLLGAAGRTPTEIAAVLFCARTSVSRMVKAYPTRLGEGGFDQPLPPGGGLTPAVRRSLRAVLPQVPAVYGWCRTRWSGAPRAAQLRLPRGLGLSASTRRRWLHALGWVWKRAQVVARDDDPQRVEELARSRYTLATLGKRAVGWFADERDLPLRPKVGYQWMPQGETVKLVTPGQNHKHSLAGALEPKTGRSLYGVGSRKTNALCRALLDRLEWLSPQAQFATVSVVVDNYGIHKAKAVARGRAAPPPLRGALPAPRLPESEPE